MLCWVAWFLVRRVPEYERLMRIGSTNMRGSCDDEGVSYEDEACFASTLAIFLRLIESGADPLVKGFWNADVQRVVQTASAQHVQFETKHSIYLSEMLVLNPTSCPRLSRFELMLVDCGPRTLACAAMSAIVASKVVATVRSLVEIRHQLPTNWTAGGQASLCERRFCCVAQEGVEALEKALFKGQAGASQCTQAVLRAAGPELSDLVLFLSRARQFWEGWLRYQHPDTGRVGYCSQYGGEVVFSWDKPTSMALAVQEWERYIDPSTQRVWLWNPLTGTARWENTIPVCTVDRWVRFIDPQTQLQWSWDPVRDHWRWEGVADLV